MSFASPNIKTHLEEAQKSTQTGGFENVGKKEKSNRQANQGIKGVQNPNPHSNYTSPTRIRRRTLPSFGFKLFGVYGLIVFFEFN